MAMNVELPDDVRAALARGDKIEAIKRLREATGMGLHESKDAVEAAIAGDPTLRARADAASREALGSLRRFGWATLGIAVVLGVAVWLQWRA
jgi:hypothetical protein